MKPSIYGYRLSEWQDHLATIGQPKFRALQIYHWLFQKRADSLQAMSDLPKSLRQSLDDTMQFTSLQEVTRQVSKDGTIKILFRLPDHATIETVIMRHDYGNSVCVSTQVGCKMGCKFCASTLGGLVRNVTAGEMVEQVMMCQRLLDREGERVSSVVLMGSGEPLENYEEAMRFIDIITDQEGLKIGQRHITVSTVGLVPAIYRLADEMRGITLAVSLHAADDETRSKMMPVNRAYDILSLLEACKYYFDKTGRRITFEYALINGHNDNVEDARKLAALLRTIPCHVNLIPVNYVPERNLTRTPQDQIREFADELERQHINATVRREKGSDIAAACGQLRAQHGAE